jgi:serine/threonine protein kinase
MGSKTSVHSLDKEDDQGGFFSKYLLGDQLGRGAFAQVRLVTKIRRASCASEDDGRDARASSANRAAKILHLGSSEKQVKSGKEKTKEDGNREHLEKVAYKEANIWSSIGKHPNCVRLYDVFFEDDFCFMVMEKCDCGLLPVLEGMPELNERWLGNFFAQMLTGIAHCHAHDVVHRDIKPDNFLIGGRHASTVKLADFGLSTILKTEGKGQLGTYGIFGTAPFMCPEMLLGLWYNEKADVWSLAVMVYALVFGRFPYTPKMQNAKAMKQAIVDGTPEPNFKPFREIEEDAISPEAMSFVQTLLQRDHTNRPSADQALKLPWMAKSLDGTHLEGMELCSLRPMLYAAKKIGAFEARGPTSGSPVDIKLNEMQMARTGMPLSSFASQQAGSPCSRKDKPSPSSSFHKGEHRLHSKDNQSMMSNSTTAGDSSSQNGSNTSISSNSNSFRGVHSLEC